jgi:DNA mismatch repair protein MutL
MSDIIRLLPDSVANQIAAGEVIQRPASVIKELIENAVDANATEITVNLKDAGRTLIQVIDNGFGMSETDARMAFERHATSKIKEAGDLFLIRSMGFRGEALASIAAVADVELKTKKPEHHLGSYIHIKGSEIVTQETISCPDGSNFSVKNLFFNIPARRKFLKADTTEIKYILSEFKKTALARPDIRFKLLHNENLLYNLDSATLKLRISDLFGKNTYKQLIPVEGNTELIQISGFIGKPEIAKKRNEEQYFFVNERFMKHPYFYKAILSAYEQIIRSDMHPTFFIYFDINPNHIDINIHPAKIQINFDDSAGIYQLLRAVVRKSLGTFNIVPSIDFDREGYVEMPFNSDDSDIVEPIISDRDNYNPFEEKGRTAKFPFTGASFEKDTVPDNWETIFQNFESSINTEKTISEQNKLPIDTYSYNKLFQLKNKYVVTPVKSGLMLIHITRAHERILFELLLNSSETRKADTQKILYPAEILLTPEDTEFLISAEPSLRSLGFDIEITENASLIIKGIPSHLSDVNAKELIETILIQIKDDSSFLSESVNENLCDVLAKKASLNFAKPLAYEELQYIVNQLFACRMPNFTHDGRKIVEIIHFDAIEKLF